MKKPILGKGSGGEMRVGYSFLIHCRKERKIRKEGRARSTKGVFVG